MNYYYILKKDASGPRFAGVKLEDGFVLDPTPTTWRTDEGWEDALPPCGNFAQVKYRDGRYYLIDLDGGCIVKQLPELDEDYYPYLPQDKRYPRFTKYSSAKAFADENWPYLSLCIIEGKNGEREGKVNPLDEVPQVSWWYPNYEMNFEVYIPAIADRLARECAELILDSDGYEKTDEYYNKLRDQLVRELIDSLPKDGRGNNEVYILNLDIDAHKFIEVDRLDLDSAKGYDEQNSRWWRVSVKPSIRSW